jgi:hypothetical protein
MSTAISIDPGASGGIVFSHNGGPPAAHKMPETVKDIADLLRDAGSEGNVTVYLEKVGGYVGGAGSPGAAMFNFGHNAGVLEGIVVALGYTLHMPTPQKWQKVLGLGNSKSHESKTAWKNHLKNRAQNLYPGIKVTLQTSDALLIHYAAVEGLLK